MLYFHTASNPPSPSSLTPPVSNPKTPCSLPTAQTHFLSNLRSLRFSFLKKDKKNIGYVWISPYADVDPSGEDIRDTLASVVMSADKGVFNPCVNSKTSPPNDEWKGSSSYVGMDVGRPRSPTSLISLTSNSNRSSMTLNFGSSLKDNSRDYSEGLLFPFERAPEALRGDIIAGTGSIGALMQGGTVVIQIVE